MEYVGIRRNTEECGRFILDISLLEYQRIALKISIFRGCSTGFQKLQSSKLKTYLWWVPESSNRFDPRTQKNRDSTSASSSHNKHNSSCLMARAIRSRAWHCQISRFSQHFTLSARIHIFVRRWQPGSQMKQTRNSSTSVRRRETLHRDKVERRLNSVVRGRRDDGGDGGAFKRQIKSASSKPGERT